MPTLSRFASLTTLAIAGCLTLPNAVHACSLILPAQHQLDPSEEAVDVEAPASPTAEPDAVSIRRGVGPTLQGVHWSSSSCDDLGFIDIALTPGDDDRTLPEEQGFSMEFVGGTLPDGMAEPNRDAVRLDDGRLWWSWIDDDTHVQEAFDFEVDVIPMDLAGNEGEPLRLRLTDPGSDGTGCSLSGAERGGAWSVLGLLGRRRRDGRRPRTLSPRRLAR